MSSLSPAVWEALTAMGLLSAVFVTLLYLLGYPVRPLFLLVRNVGLSIGFLLLYNRIFSPLGLGIGVNPLTVGALSLFGAEGFAAIHVVLLLVRTLI